MRASALFDVQYIRDQLDDPAMRDASDAVLGNALATDTSLFDVSPSLFFDPAFYRARYADIAGYTAHPFLHWVKHGFYEGRQPHPLIDVLHLFHGTKRAGQALDTPDDLPALVRIADPHPLFSNRFVRAAYGDKVDDYPSPLEFYLLAGEPRVKEASVWFSADRYLAEHPEVATSGRDPLIDFLFRGDRLGIDRRLVRGVLSANGLRPDDHRGPLPWPLDASGYQELEDVAIPELSGGLPAHTRAVVGVVLYRTDWSDFDRLVAALDRETRAIDQQPGTTVRLDLAVNDQRAETYREWLHTLAPSSIATRVIDSGSNVGFGRAHNRLMSDAFSAAATHYVGLNPDGFLMRGSLESLLSLTAALADEALIEVDAFPVGHPKWFDPVGLDTAWVSGAAFLMPRKVHEVVGGFDERFHMYCEDVDLSWRVREAGFRTVVCPTAHFYHDVAPRLDVVDREATKAMFLSARQLGQKWGGPAFVRRMEDILVEQGYAKREDLPALPPPERADSAIPDFDHDLRFAVSRYW